MRKKAIIDEIVKRIEGVYAGEPAITPITQEYDGLTIEDAYSVQNQYVNNRLAEGAALKGYKVGLTSKAMQEFAGTDEPDYGALLDYMFLHEGASIRASDWLDPLVEIEIAFVLKEPLSGGRITPVDVIRATDFVAPAIELVDFRMKRAMGINFIDTVADLAAVGGVIVGANPMKLEDIDVRRISGALYKNKEKVHEGEASAVLGNPVNAVAWLANKLHEFGVSFEPGQLILTGSFIRAEPVSAGDQIVAKFDQGFGDVAINFE